MSIGVELLTSPAYSSLRAHSGLDPAQNGFHAPDAPPGDLGRTIVMVTHATKNVMLADKVVFCTRRLPSLVWPAG